MRHLLLLLVSPLLLSCLCDSDTIRDEIQNKAGLYDLIIGQVPKHSEEYYKKRLDDQVKIIAESEGTIGFNTIATAHIRLGQFAEAEEKLRYVQRKVPNDYYTLSNLGVLYKKKGDYSKAIILMNQALKLNPEGHMGLGDWYLKMLVYKYQSEQKEQPKNFLGIDYTKKYRPGGYRVKNIPLMRVKFMRLIKNDQHFADGFLALADFLAGTGDLNLALRAYMRAQQLGHSRKDQIDEMIKGIFEHINHRVSDEKKLTQMLKATKQQILDEFKKAEEWSKSFQAMEAKLLMKYKNVDFKTTYQALKKSGVSHYRP